METQYYIELLIEGPDGNILTFEILKDKGITLAEAKQAAGGIYMGGYIHKESEVTIDSAYTLYPPTAIKQIRLVPKQLIV